MIYGGLAVGVGSPREPPGRINNLRVNPVEPSGIEPLTS